MKISTQWIEVKVEDGSQMKAFVARPEDTATAPSLLILQEAFGVNPHIRSLCERFAREGFVALAPELFHRTAPGFECAYTDLPAAMPHLKALTPHTLELDLRAAYNWLRTQPDLSSSRIGAVGFCMGGKAAFIANAALPLRAAVSFYGGGIAPDLLSLAEKQNAPVFFVWGGLDQHIPETQRNLIFDAMKKAQKPFINQVYETANHGFHCDDRAAYHPEAARAAWSATLDFLRENLR